MGAAILVTKLFIPQPRFKSIARTRLIESLNAGLHRSLTVISGPAGFGKTTLVSAWVVASGPPVAWVSLDAGDNDLTRFITYVVAALQSIAPNFGTGILGTLNASFPPAIESTLTALLNEMAALPERVILVLDDYHAISAKPVHDAVAYLVEHLPAQVHLVIATREEPDLPMSRLRVRDQATELRAADLRFTSAETARFLGDVMGLDLSPDAFATLERRAEGWVAGLQLAALALHATIAANGPDSVNAFVKSFDGSHRFVLDYLVEEIVSKQPAHIQSFLLRTSILNRLCGSLCDAVVCDEHAAGQEMLAYLERANLFVVPLDSHRQWYRYHHLFAEALQVQLRKHNSGEVRDLHRAATEWHARNALPVDAIHHALAAEDYEYAANLIELEARAMMTSYQQSTWLAWVKALPADLVRVRPVLSVYYASVLMPDDLNSADAHLRDAEHWLHVSAQTSNENDVAPAVHLGMVVANAEEYRSTPGLVSIMRAYHAAASGNVSDSLRHARTALDCLPQSDTFWRGAATSLLGMTSWAMGDLEAASKFLSAGITGLDSAAGMNASVGAIYLHADIRLAQGRLREARDACRQTLARVAESDRPAPQGTADLHVILSEVYFEQDDLDEAHAHLMMSQALGEYARITECRHRWPVAMARIAQARSEFTRALDLLDDAERMYLAGPVPNARPIAAIKARVWIVQGRLAEAEAWAREKGLSSEDPLSFIREYEHITLARLLLAQDKRARTARDTHAAAALLERLLPAAEMGQRAGSVIEILALQALAQDAQGNLDRALDMLNRTLQVAEPEGFVRVFVTEGAPMARLLSQLATRRMATDFAKRVLAAFAHAASGHSAGSLSPAQSLIEPLSARELEILQLVAQGLSNQEIARRLSISLSTVKGHNLRIFGKLQVERRTEAIARARALGLL